MPLQVWLPLNGNLNNQGASNVSITNNGATVDTNGKMGKCYSLNGSSNYININNLPNPKDVSITFWMLRTANTGTRQFMFTAWNGVTCELTVNNAIHCYVAPNHGACDSTSAITTSSGWVHVAYTFQDKVGGKLYINGNLITSTNSTNSINWTTTSGNIGNYSNMYYTGKINDFRFYDHVLSAKEVKEISKGIIAHYPLDGNGRSVDNLFRGSAMTAAERASTGFIDNGSTDWTKPFRYYNGNANIHSFSDNIDTVTLNSTGNLGIAFQRKATDISLDSSSYYTISCEARCTKANAQLAIGLSYYNTSNSWVWRGGSNTQNFNNTTDWQKFSLTFKPDVDTQYIMYCLTVYQATASTSEIFQIRKCKLEKGSVATPWCPNSADVEYNNMGLNSSSVKDTSGFNNNGTFSTNKPTVSNDSIRYNSCMLFNGTNNFIMCGRGAMVTDAITINIWAQRDWNTYIDSRFISCTETGGWNIYPLSNKKIEVDIGTGTTSNTYKGLASAAAIADSNWHMFTCTYDGLNLKLYIDGVLSNTLEAYTTKTPIFYNSSNGIFIGAEAGNNTTTPAGAYFNGKISDVRIYATALSADDIKELYQVSSHICSNGTMMAYNFVEN